MTPRELAKIELDTDGLDDDLARARHARQEGMPVYHEDSGEYVSDNTESVSAQRVSDDGYTLNIVNEEDLYQPTEPMPQLDAVSLAERDDLSRLPKIDNDMAIENATKEDIKEYLASEVFKCHSAHNAEKLSEFAYAPTDKGIILSAKKPFSNANYKRMRALLRRRVRPSRFVHSVLVSETAEKLALAYGYDPKVARMAGLLHDWDKALSPKRLRDRVSYYRLPIDGATQINMPQLLHGPTAAAVLADEFPEFGKEVFQAIERHTVGGIPMSKLDMIVFCADKIEPSHDVPLYRKLYDQIGKIDLRDMFLAVQKEGLSYLLSVDKPLNVDAVEVWNFYAAEKLRDND